MSPLPSTLGKRYYCDYGYSDYDGYGCSYSAWNAYGRWLLLVAFIIGVFLIFLMFSCITARRRRRAGLHPYRFTGWAGGAPPGHGQAQFAGNQPYGAQPYQQGNNAPPAYGQPARDGTYYGNNQGANQGYFGGQQNGIELQQPNPAYQGPGGGDPVYTPHGAPPGKKVGDDGIIR